MIAALAAAGSLYFTGGSLEASRAQSAVVEQGQLTDRFTKAVDQLDRAGPDHLQARLGGIYALERLARDSPRDHPTVVEVLSAFVRTTTPQPDLDAEFGKQCPTQPVTPDVHAALTVLGRRNLTHDRSDEPVNLRNTCLHRADLSGTNLSGANLSGADLSEANLRSADLQAADLSEADLSDASLSGADLSSAFLIHADLSDAIFNGANLTRTDLSSADLNGAVVRGADLSGAVLSGASLIGADLTRAEHDRHTVVYEVQVDENTVGVWW